MTSCPREMRSVPMVSAPIMALPPGLSVMLRAWTWGCSASRRASSRMRRPLRSVMMPREVTSSTQVTKVSVSVSRWRRVDLCQAPATGLVEVVMEMRPSVSSTRWKGEASA